MLDTLSMHKIILDDYLDPNWCCLVLFCIHPSPELVEKWLPVMEYTSDRSHLRRRECLKGRADYDPSLAGIRNFNNYDETADYDKPIKIPAIAKDDQMQAAFLLESLEQCLIYNNASGYIKLAIPALRVDMNWEPYIKPMQELSYDI